VTDVVRATDSLGNVASANVTVGPATGGGGGGGGGGGCSAAGGAPALALALLALLRSGRRRQSPRVRG
jgi:uncharacterized protein (TIGR03382 family)